MYQVARRKALLAAISLVVLIGVVSFVLVYRLTHEARTPHLIPPCGATTPASITCK